MGEEEGWGEWGSRRGGGMGEVEGGGGRWATSGGRNG
jgi:hypothetical protein